MPTGVFTFDYYLADFVAQFRKIAEAIGWEIPGEFEPFLRELERGTDLRDTDLEDYLAVGSFSPSLGVQRLATQAVASSTFTAISFDTDAWASTELFEWDGATKVTVQQAGIVSLTGNATFAANGTGHRYAGLRINGLVSLTPNWMPAIGVVDQGVPAAKLYPVVEGDYVELVVWQSSGGNLDVTGTLDLAWLGQSG